MLSIESQPFAEMKAHAEATYPNECVGAMIGTITDGDKVVEPDCDAMSSWFECRDIDTTPADVRRGYEYMHNTSSTLGPFGSVKYSDGTPYATAATACSDHPSASILEVMMGPSGCVQAAPSTRPATAIENLDIEPTISLRICLSFYPPAPSIRDR